MPKNNVASIYDDVCLPMLCKMCNDRGIKDYFEKDDDEIKELLLKWDEEHQNEDGEKNNMAKNKSDDIDELDDLDEIGGDEELGLDEDKSDDELDEKEEDEKEEEKDDDIDNLADDILDESEDTVAEEKKTKKTKAEKSEKKVEKSEKSEKKSEKKAEKSDNGGKGRQKVERTPETHKSPFEESSAGHHVFMVLKQAKGHSLDKLVEGIAKRLEKYPDVKKPSNIKAKAKIIMGVITSGQKGKWGKFVDEKGKVTYQAD